MIGGNRNGGPIGIRVSVQRRLIGVIEEGEKLVVLGLLNWVVLMGVAPRTGERQPEEDGSEGFNSIKIILHLKLFRDCSPFTCAWVHADEARGESLFHCWLVEKVAGELPSDEVIQRQVLVQGTHNPVAIRVDAASIVQMQTVRVSVPDCVKPVSGLVFSITRACKQLVDEPIVGRR